MADKNRYYIRLIVVVAALLLQTHSGRAQQHFAGFRAGYGMGTIARIEPAETRSGAIWGLLSGGVAYKYYGERSRFVNGVEIDLLFQQRGYKRHIPYEGAPGDETTIFLRKINSVELPVLWHPHYEFFKGRLGVFINLGVSASYNINSTYEWRSEKISEAEEGSSGKNFTTLEKGKYKMKVARDNWWNYGLVGGIGLTYIAGRSEFFFEGRYYLGYSDILKNRSVYEGNPRSSPVDGMTFSLGYFYRLGSGKKKDKIDIPEESILPLQETTGETGELPTSPADPSTETIDTQQQEAGIESETTGTPARTDEDRQQQQQQQEQQQQEQE